MKLLLLKTSSAKTMIEEIEDLLINKELERKNKIQQKAF
jgi:hypothetical protein